MSSFEHKPFTTELFRARYDDGESVYDEDFIATCDHEFGHGGVEVDQIPITIYRALVTWAPWRRAYWDEENGSVHARDIGGYEDPQTAQIKRLQAAVKELLEIYEYQTLGEIIPLEDIGLTQEDME